MSVFSKIFASTLLFFTAFSVFFGFSSISTQAQSCLQATANFVYVNGVWQGQWSDWQTAGCGRAYMVSAVAKNGSQSWKLEGFWDGQTWKNYDQSSISWQKDAGTNNFTNKTLCYHSFGMFSGYHNWSTCNPKEQYQAYIISNPPSSFDQDKLGFGSQIEVSGPVDCQSNGNCYVQQTSLKLTKKEEPYYVKIYRLGAENKLNFHLRKIRKTETPIAETLTHFFGEFETQWADYPEIYRSANLAKDGTLTLEFDPKIYLYEDNSQYLQELVMTLKQFPSVKKVKFTVNGQPFNFNSPTGQYEF